jgi:pimeloyl-ACP methyl ester carboxylesterase
MVCGSSNARVGRATLVGLVLASGAAQAQHAKSPGATPTPATPIFVDTPCTDLWGTSASMPAGSMRCGTVTVPQNRAKPTDASLLSVVLPVVVYSMPGAHGTPIVFLPGGPAESSIEAAQKVLLETPTGQMLVREHPVIVFDRRGYSPIAGRASPDLGTIVFEPRARRELAVGPLVDSLKRRSHELKAHGIDPANFTTMPAVEDIYDVVRALNVEKVILFGASYGSRESLHFMRRHPGMVELSILDGIAPPQATQILDSTYMANTGREIARRIIGECRADAVCAGQFGDISQALDRLSDTVKSKLRRTAQFAAADNWRTIEVAGASVLSVLGVASSSEEVRAILPRIVTEVADQDTLHDEFALRVFLAAAIDPSLQTASRQIAPLAYYIALCGDRPQGEPKAGNRQLCDALGVPFTGPEAITPVTSDIPTLLISSGYDAQTPAPLADDAAKTLSHARRAHFAMTGHVAFSRPVVMACVALVIDSFMRRPDDAPSTSCIGSVTPAFLPRVDGAVAGKP